MPHALGFHPEQSVVLLSLRPPRGRLGLVVRVDLEPCALPVGSQMLSVMAGHLRADGAERILCVVYAPGTVEEARSSATVRAAVAAVETTPRMPEASEVWLVTPTGYASFDCQDVTCCPPQGRDLTELAESRVGVEFTVRGSAPRARRSDLAPPRSSSGAARRSFAAAHTRARAELAKAGSSGETAETSVADAYAAEAFGVLTASVPRPNVLGRLAALLALPRVRDAVLLSLATTSATGAITSPGSLGGPAGAAQLRSLLEPGAPHPDIERVDSAVAVLAAAASFAKPSVRAEVCAVLAWLHWWRGDGASAALASAEAVSLEPRHRLAVLVGAIVQRGLPPGWTRLAVSA